MADRQETEVREVKSEDPSLSPAANELLTEELRDAVGTDRVEVPQGTPHHERDAHSAAGSSFGAQLVTNRILLAITFFAALVVGAIVSLAVGSWLFVVIACVIHAVSAFAVLTVLATAARQTEHVAPGVAARLEDEGVPDPDVALSELVAEYGGAQPGVGIPATVATGANRQTADPKDEPARAAAQQRTVQTPAGVPTEPAGDGSPMDRVLLQGLAAALALLAVAGGVLAIWLGTRMLAIPAVMLPLIALWLILQNRMGGDKEQTQREPAPGVRGRTITSVAAVVLLVGGFVALVGWLGDLA
jgi:hypothetical protein